MARWKFFGVTVREMEVESLGTVIEFLRARIGRYSITRAITIKRGARHYYHIPPRKRIEVRNCRPGAWSGKK